MHRVTRLLWLAGILLLFAGLPARAEIVVFAEGSFVKVVSHRIEDDKISAIESALAKLNESSQKMGAAMYAAAEADQAAAGGTTEATGDADDDVVDAEIVDETTDGTDSADSADSSEGESK